MDEIQEPLTSIRQAEVSVIRRVALAKEKAERIRVDAQTEAATILEAARIQAERDGQLLVKESHIEGQSEKQAILESAQNRVDDLAKRRQMRRGEAVAWVLRFVLGEREAET